MLPSFSTVNVEASREDRYQCSATANGNFNAVGTAEMEEKPVVVHDYPNKRGACPPAGVFRPSARALGCGFGEKL